MRQKRDRQRYMQWSDTHGLKIVRKFHQKYKRMDALLDEIPQILTLAHRDLEAVMGKSTRGRRGDYTTENIVRALIVHQMEATPFRKTAILIAESEALQEFVRLGNRSVMDFTFLDRCFNALRPETWEAMLQAMNGHAVEQSLIDPKDIRKDCTVIEANIHYPTDSSLLWDGYRVLTRLLRQAQKLAPGRLAHRYHDNKVKKRHLFITRYTASQSRHQKKQVKRKYKQLLGDVSRVLGIARGFCDSIVATDPIELSLVAEAMKEYLPAVRTVIQVAERVNVRGESVPAKEKVFSLFEQHVELIKRGKRAKPVEFGHKVFLAQTREKVIVDYKVLAQQVPDSELTPEALERHKKQFGKPPESISADCAFWAGEEAMDKLKEEVDTVAIAKNVKQAVRDIPVEWLRFRAGIEGSISVLKRAFRLARCVYRGFRNFAASVGMAIFCHNLLRLSTCCRM